MVDLLVDFDGSDTTFEKLTFWDITGNGDYAMLAAVRTPAANTLQRYWLAIDPKLQIASIARDDDTSKRVYLQPSDITTFAATSYTLIVGCASCSDGKGWLQFYDTRSMQLLNEISGTNGYQYIGHNISLMKNADNTDQIWYSSRNGQTMHLNSVVIV